MPAEFVRWAEKTAEKDKTEVCDIILQVLSIALDSPLNLQILLGCDLLSIASHLSHLPISISYPYLYASSQADEHATIFRRILRIHPEFNQKFRNWTSGGPRGNPIAEIGRISLGRVNTFSMKKIMKSEEDTSKSDHPEEMNYLILLWSPFEMLRSAAAFLLLSVTVASAVRSRRVYDEDCSEESFKQFQADHGKKATEKDYERRQRLCEIIEENKIHNQGNVSFSRNINELADLTVAEYKKRLGFIPIFNSTRRKRQFYSSSSSSSNVPASVDWREKGIVTAIKNQGQCGACWAFATTGSIEGQLAKSGKNLTSLSEQNLVDCSVQNLGCDGGNTAWAMSYVKSNGGIDKEVSYPYKARQGSCRYSFSKSGGEDKGYVSLARGDEGALQEAVATIGPIAVAIDASHNSFAYYASGVYYEPSCSSTALDHAILIVGYGSDPAYGDYWLIKNSWGTSWGDNGYGMMARNRGNNCGIATEAVYPKV
ncbi:hypothetical protein PRIPAC_72302 [Pristionchus pacificus]|uniref:Peptidase n=1 Tax=Pristionchus pacificus TaxID=54126 RepID=A0A2A6CR39_PRIPA|nr:hypothetical protein PRIPAC_72302 [Pristionchus pacificus]|eukprot:PDM80675.1 Peptidase [Pristionchus pacificus]